MTEGRREDSLSPHCSQLTPLPRQVQIICLLPWVLTQRWPMK